MKKFHIMLGYPKLPVITVLLAVGLTVPSLWNGFCFDDYLQRLILSGDNPVSRNIPATPWNLFCFHKGDEDYTERLIYEAAFPWWMDGIRFRAYFFRPVSSLSHSLDYLLWPDSPVLMHAQSLLWYAVLVGLATLLYRRMMGVTWAAGLAALFFALDDAHGFPAGWLANRNALLACMFGLLCLLAHHRWRQKAWNIGAVVAPLCLALSLLSGEAGLSINGYLLAYAIFFEQASLHERMTSLIPYGVVMFFWTLTYVLLGCGIEGMAFYTDPLRETLPYIVKLYERIPVFMLGQLGFPPVVYYTFWPEMMRWAGMVFCGLLILVFFPVLRRDRIARFWATGMIISILPISAVWPHDRNLLFMGIGAMGLLACWFNHFSRIPWREKSQLWRISVRTMMVLFIIIHGLLAPLALPLTSSIMARFQQKVEMAAAGLPSGPEYEDARLISVNAPNYLFYVHNIAHMRAVQGQYTHLRALTVGKTPLLVTRLDENSIKITADGGTLIDIDRGFRIYQYATSYPGQSVKQFDVVVEVLEVSDGKPSAAIFRFSEPLDNSHYLWFNWKDDTYIPFSLPQVGRTVSVEGARFDWR
jgi:hypothetical protein